MNWTELEKTNATFIRALLSKTFSPPRTDKMNPIHKRAVFNKKNKNKKQISNWMKMHNHSKMCFQKHARATDAVQL